MWVLGATEVLFLHTELWGLPFLLAAALALRNERWALAAVSVGVAAVLREIYVLPLLFGLILVPRRRAWLATLAVVVGLGVLHAVLATDVLADQGREAPFGQSGHGFRYVLSALSPSDRPSAGSSASPASSSASSAWPSGGGTTPGPGSCSPSPG